MTNILTALDTPFSPSQLLVKVLLDLATDVEIAPDLVVDSAELLVEAQNIGGRLQTGIKAVEAERIERVKPLNEQVAIVNAGYKSVQETLKVLVDGLKLKCISYDSKVKLEAAQREHEERARRDAEFAQAKEKEARAQAEARALLVLASATPGDEGQKLIEQAAAVADTGRAAIAEVAPVRVAPVEAKAKGVSEKWVADIENDVAVIIHVGKLLERGDMTLRSLVTVERSVANALAKLMKDDLNIPGIKARPFSQMSMRAK